MADGPFVYCFAKDLRLDDNAGLTAAASRANVIPVLLIDPILERQLKASPRRAAFFCAAAAALDAELAERGTRLVVRRGDARRALPAVAREAGAGGVAWSASYDAAGMASDRAAQSALEEGGIEAHVVHDAPAIAPEESDAVRTAEGAGYRAFAPYFDAWCGLPIASHEQPLLLRFENAGLSGDPLPSPAEFGGAGTAAGDAGPAHARRGFERFLRDGAAQYSFAATLPSDDRTSHLAPHLSFGTISARYVVQRVRERLGDPFALSEERQSLRLFLRALARRDFFLQLGWFHPQTADDPLQEKMRGFRWATEHPALEAWRSGKTGYPLVDAGVRQLRATGWMHPHVRAVAASWLCFDLGVDWRVGREEWNRWLVEDDAALATGNWQWIAGVGADMAQYPRIYNPERQRRRYDPAGAYVRQWVPELRNVPVDVWHGRTQATPQLALDLYAGAEYPAPAVDHAVAARSFLRRYRAFASS